MSDNLSRLRHQDWAPRHDRKRTIAALVAKLVLLGVVTALLIGCVLRWAE